MVEIRRASESDAQVLTELGRSTFLATFAENNSPENIEIYVRATFRMEKQLNEIRDLKRRIEIAWVDGNPAGFIHLLDGQPEACVTGERPIELLRFYVEAKWHGRGLGQSLMDRCLAIAREEGFKTLWLGVWEHNSRALAFYKKYGFTVVGQHLFQMGNDSQLDHIMARTV